MKLLVAGIGLAYGQFESQGSFAIVGDDYDTRVVGVGWGTPAIDPYVVPPVLATSLALEGHEVLAHLMATGSDAAIMYQEIFRAVAPSIKCLFSRCADAITPSQFSELKDELISFITSHTPDAVVIGNIRPLAAIAAAEAARQAGVAIFVAYDPFPIHQRDLLLLRNGVRYETLTESEFKAAFQQKIVLIRV